VRQIAPLGALMPENDHAVHMAMHRMVAFGEDLLASHADFGRQIPEKRLARVILRCGTPVNSAARRQTRVRFWPKADRGAAIHPYALKGSPS
jgi:hypothetical protein